MVKYKVLQHKQQKCDTNKQVSKNLLVLLEVAVA